MAFSRGAAQKSLQTRAVMLTCDMILSTLVLAPIIAAAGWAFLVWLGGGGLGAAILVFIVLKLLGR